VRDVTASTKWWMAAIGVPCNVTGPAGATLAEWHPLPAAPADPSGGGAAGVPVAAVPASVLDSLALFLSACRAGSGREAKIAQKALLNQMEACAE